jgi:chorismate synthase
MKFRFQTAGESHGRCLLGLIEGIPAGLYLSESDISPDLKRRMQGHGRGGRMKIEADEAILLSGTFRGKTTGAPIALMIENKDWQLKNEEKLPVINFPRPGHADLAGLLKYNQEDIRTISERASARETAGRVAIGAVAKKFLKEFGLEILGVALEIGGIASSLRTTSIAELKDTVENSPVRFPDPEKEKEVIQLIDQVKEQGDSLGGSFLVIAENIPPGLGSYVQWDKRLDGKLAQALMSIQGIKAVEIGDGIANSKRKGTEAHDEIGYKDGVFLRYSNRAGGIEGGISNGEPILASAYMKPISTIRKQMRSIDLKTKEPANSHYQRSDVCAVPAASIIGEAMMALVLADAFLDKFGGDSIQETSQNFNHYLTLLEKR